MATSSPAAQSANPYLAGFLAPVCAEVTATDLPVTGHIPEFLDGRYLRNGPNPVAEVDPAAYHWFTGDAMVHGVALRDGKARWYRNRWVRTPRVCAALGEPAPTAADPRAGMLSGSPNTSVLAHAGQTLALVEGGVANYRLTDDLDTVGTCDFDGTLAGGYTAHPHRDPRTGELHAVSYSFARGRTVQYSVIDTRGHARRTVDIAVAGAPMMHDFSLTEKYVVLYDLPVTFDPVQVLPAAMPRWLKPPARLVAQSLLGRVAMPSPIVAMVNRRTRSSSAGLPFAWNLDYPARIGVMPRDGGSADIRWFDIEPCYVYHPVNAYSETRDGVEVVVLDVVRYERMFDRDRRGPGDVPPTLDRWTVNLATGSVASERRDDRPQEFPRINEALLGSRHRFGYTVGIAGFPSAGPATLSTALYKHDYATGASAVAPLDADLLIGEMSFVPRPGGRAEDDGVLIGFGCHRHRDEGRLLLVDAETLEPMADVHLPQRVPMGIHGTWAPAG